MNRLLIKSALPLMVVATFASSTLSSRGGDAIIFPKDIPKNEASKAEPGKQVPGTRESLRVWDSLPASDPRNLDGLIRPGLHNSKRKTKEEQQLQREQDQKKNWLLLRPDQLHEEQEQKENVPFPDRDSQAEAAHENRDYTFHGLQDPKDSREGARQNQRANPPGHNGSVSRGSAEDSRSQESRKTALPGKSGQDLGVHASQELDLRDLLGPNREDQSPEIGKSDPIWRDVWGSGGSTRTREQQLNRLDKLGGSLATETKWPSDPGRAPSPPSFPKSLDTPPRGGVFGPNQDLGAPSTPRNFLTPGMPDWNAPRSSVASRGGPSGPGFNSLDQQPVSRPSVIRPTVLEIPQRKL